MLAIVFSFYPFLFGQHARAEFRDDSGESIATLFR